MGAEGICGRGDSQIRKVEDTLPTSAAGGPTFLKGVNLSETSLSPAPSHIGESESSSLLFFDASVPSLCLFYLRFRVLRRGGGGMTKVRPKIKHEHTHPANGEGGPGLPRAHAHEAEAQLPVEPMFTDESEQRQDHGGTEHVEDPRHVVHVQLAAHHLVLLVVADARHLSVRHTSVYVEEVWVNLASKDVIRGQTGGASLSLTVCCLNIPADGKCPSSASCIDP
ncbi:hypothetical protein EYF80_006081 [Liparis tanakae]|uniref:Uncharacterized protein n=1 Tax=Liparis tanakae TaxID=230148 RepID=A0A4Z2J265_9TELE|nr:hypothetical protein EYF80_006081 [Liparis tanakae]